MAVSPLTQAVVEELLVAVSAVEAAFAPLAVAVVAPAPRCRLPAQRTRGLALRSLSPRCPLLEQARGQQQRGQRSLPHQRQLA